MIPCIISKFYFNSKYVTALRSKQRKEKNFIYFSIKKVCKKFLFKIVSIDKDIFETSYDIQKTIICRNIFNIKSNKYNLDTKEDFIVGYIGTFLKEKGIEKQVEAKINLIEFLKRIN